MERTDASDFAEGFCEIADRHDWPDSVRPNASDFPEAFWQIGRGHRRPSLSVGPTTSCSSQRIREILKSARAGVARSVNTTQVTAYWLIGREIVEEEQEGKKRAGYGEALLQDLAQRLKADFGPGYSVHNLKFIRQFYLEYPALMDRAEIGYALRSQSWKPGRLIRLTQ